MKEAGGTYIPNKEGILSCPARKKVLAGQEPGTFE